MNWCKIRSLFFLVVFLSPFFKVYAFRPTFTPLVSYTNVTVYQPEEHDQQRVSYGARVRIGWRLLGLEVQYTEGTFDKDFADGSKAANETQAARVGLSSIFGSGLISLTAGAGIEGRRETNTFTDAEGVKTVEGPTEEKDPYATARLNLNLASGISGFAGVTVIFVDEDNLSRLNRQREELSLGFSIHI